ncbi:tumor necrosis factor receptor superfamily member 12A [Prionailurus iriomotensis]
MVSGPLRPLPRLLALGLGLALLGAVAGERVPGTTPCSRGSSWSADLDKCMDCASCPARPHSDFCLGSPIEETGGEGCPGVALIQ